MNKAQRPKCPKKIDGASIPKFSGNESPKYYLKWVNMLEAFFKQEGMDEYAKMCFASSSLCDFAFSGWLQSRERTYGKTGREVVTWVEMKAELNEQFILPDYFEAKHQNDRSEIQDRSMKETDNLEAFLERLNKAVEALVAKEAIKESVSDNPTPEPASHESKSSEVVPDLPANEPTSNPPTEEVHEPLIDDLEPFRLLDALESSPFTEELTLISIREIHASKPKSLLLEVPSIQVPEQNQSEPVLSSTESTICSEVVHQFSDPFKLQLDRKHSLEFLRKIIMLHWIQQFWADWMTISGKYCRYVIQSRSRRSLIWTQHLSLPSFLCHLRIRGRILLKSERTDAGQKRIGSPNVILHGPNPLGPFVRAKSVGSDPLTSHF